MKYCFTDTPVEGFTQRNPQYWAISTPPKDAESVIIGSKYPAIKAYFEAKGVNIASDKPAKVTRENFDTMKRGDVLELLAAHGLTEADLEGQKLPELRAILKDAVFV